MTQKRFLCQLEIDIYADSAVEAASEANDTVKDPECAEFVFDVTDETGETSRVMDGKIVPYDILLRIVELATALRQLGCAVCVFTPEELAGANPRLIADLMCERGNAALEDLRG